MNTAAKMFLVKKLKTKAVRAIKERRERNKRWRTDLVKRYWINNSDDEYEELAHEPTDKLTVTIGKNEFSTQQPEVFDQGLVGVLKDEFFPVQICK